MAIGDNSENEAETKILTESESLAIIHREDTPIEKQLANEAETEILSALSTCEETDYSKGSRDHLWSVFNRWLNDPVLLSATSQLRIVVLNELTFRLGDANLRKEAWETFRELARKNVIDDSAGMRISLRIATFELIAEPPEVPEDLKLLFSMAGDPETRWAVFAAYEKTPSRLRSHAAMYSGGSVTDADCDEWFRKQWIREFEDLIPESGD